MKLKIEGLSKTELLAKLSVYSALYGLLAINYIDLVTERKVSRVIIVYKDRLTRFGFETLRKLFQAFGTAIEVINSEEKTPQEELVEDLITIVSHFAGKLYGMRSHKEVVEGVRKLVSG
jgi:putative resolvase